MEVLLDETFAVELLIKGVKGTDRVLMLGYGPCYKNKYGKPNGETH